MMRAIIIIMAAMIYHCIETLHSLCVNVAASCDDNNRDAILFFILVDDDDDDDSEVTVRH
jgi:hypothetical protein